MAFVSVSGLNKYYSVAGKRLHVLRESGPLYRAAEIAADLRRDRSRGE